MEPDVFDAILSDIADGSSMRQACAKHEVSRRTFLRYVDGAEDRAHQYARALSVGCESIADDILDIADDGSGDIEIRTNSQGEEYEAQNAEFAARSRLRVDARKWLLSKRMPKKYGERLTHDGDPDNPIALAVRWKADDA